MSLGVKSGATIRVGIIGFGSQGRLHFEHLWSTPPFAVEWICDRRTDSTAGLPKTLRVRSLKDALARDVQLIVIATPPASHFGVGKAMLWANRNILLEKPTSVSCSETQQLLRIARRRRLCILTHFNRRWDPDFLTVKRALAVYDFGRIHEVESRVTDSYGLSERYPGRKRWKLRYPGGGILLDWAPHLFDQLFELMGQRRPQHIYCRKARPNRLVDQRLEEQFTIQVSYPDCIAMLAASWNHGLAPPRWSIYGTRAAFSIEKLGGTDGTIRWRTGDQVLEQRFGAPHESATESFRTLVEKSLQDPSVRFMEEQRMERVSYGIELARRSCLANRPIAWRLGDVGVGSEIRWRANVVD